MGFVRDHRIRDHWISQHKAKVIGAVLAVILVATAAVIALTSPGADALSLSSMPRPIAPVQAGPVQQLCGSAAPGQARCLAERQTSPGSTVAGATGGTGTGHASSDEVAPSATPGGYGPADLVDAYQLDTSKGFGQTVAVVDAYDDPTAAADLAVYRSQYGLPACTASTGCFQKVNQNGSASTLPGPDRGWAGEIALDLDMVSAVCPQCNILLVEANSSYLSDLGAAVNTAVALGAKFVSNSYGGGDTAGYDSYYNHPGVAITASTGDSGYGVSFPASSPYVTAVGGTTLLRSGTTSRGWTESSWAGAGSGCSGIAAKPAFQTMTGCANRATADVSAVANPNTGVAVYSTYGGGGWGVYGGTSASAPIVAATYALAGTPGANDYPNAYPYANSGELNDVTSGSSGSCATPAWCSARAGWDGPTGLGTPDSAAAFSATGAVNGTPVRFGLVGKVSGEQLAGLPVSISATPMLPDGDALAALSWKAARTDCTVGSTTSADTTVSCPAGLIGATTVTATATDTAGVTKTISLALSFAAVPNKRPVTITLGLPGQTGSSQSLCSGLASPVRAVLTDTATGLPVKGVAVAFSRQAGTAAATAAGSASSGADGSATLTATSTVAVTLAASTGAVGPFAAGAKASLAVTAGKCTPTLTAAVDHTLSYYGDPLTVTGLLTRSSDSGPVPMPNAAVQISETVNGRSTVLGSITSDASGVLSGTVRPVASGALTANLPAGTAWSGASVALGSLTVLTPTTELTGSADRLDVGYADAITVSGTLSRRGSILTGLARGAVAIRSTQAGRITVLGSATAAADGSYRIAVHPRSVGELSAAYAGGPGQPAASLDLGALTVGTWDSTVSLAATTPVVTAGTAMKLTGSVQRAYEGQNSNAPSVAVGIYLQASTGVVSLLSTVSTTAAGSYTAMVTPVENGTLTARVHAVPGYADSTSDGVVIGVSTRVVATAPTTVPGGRPVPVMITLTAPRAGTVAVQELLNGTWTTVATGTTTSAGRASVPVTGLSVGSHTLRVYFGGDDRGSANSSSSMTVVVKA